MCSRRLYWLVWLPLLVSNVAPLSGQSLERQLLQSGSPRLAELAMREGDARRGAVIFHQPDLACTRCHGRPGEVAAAENLGPNLAMLGDEVTPTFIVESILEPSKAIRPAYQTTILHLQDGRVLAGFVASESADAVSLRSAADGRVVVVPHSEIGQRTTPSDSLMPPGQVNQLASRQQFLDLVRYVVEIAQGGPDRAQQLQPPQHLLTLALPEYEQHLDHRRLIESLDDASLQRGAVIYARICANCHGTLERAGSLPTSRRFAGEAFKNGATPLALYHTLTRGFGMMPPQTQLVPRQKYDVIHYLREVFLRPHNPRQYVALTAEDWAALPPGDTLGPEPPQIDLWQRADYGPTLNNTYEFGRDGANFAHKGIAVRLDPGTGGVARGSAWLVFDHDTLRVAAAWSGAGFIDWHGIHFDGAHAVHPRAVGQALVKNPTGVGWGHPASGSWSDIRLIGRDGRHYGPLPREWGHYRGLYRCGNRAVFAYTLGEVAVFESPWLAAAAPSGEPEGEPDAALAAVTSPIVARVFNIGHRERPLELLVATERGTGLEQTTLTLIQSPPVQHPIGQEKASPLGNLTPSPPSQALPVQVAVVALPRRGGRSRRAAPPAPSPLETWEPSPGSLMMGVAPSTEGMEWYAAGDALRLRLPAGPPLKFMVWMLRSSQVADFSRKAQIASAVMQRSPDLDLGPLMQGGPPQWPETLVMPAHLGGDAGPLAVDVLTHPTENPWSTQLRLTGFDFFPDGRRAAVAAWDGDVWLVDGLQQLETAAAGQQVDLTWRRIASGLFQPLGVKIVRGAIHVTCRDQIVILRDLNGDGETDYYENFNSDHQVTEHFHEFAMGLQTDAAGNFYYAKSARHALPAIVPQHGTLLKVSPDGAQTEILATGFRAANGVCLNADGSFVVTDQEGHWNPKNRINWVVPGGFYGNMFGYHAITDPADSAMEQPLAWITNAFDRSPAELLWVESERWRPLQGMLLNMSYGYGRLYVVPFEKVRGVRQGCLCSMPMPDFPTGIMRGRFHPTDQQLYLCGMVAWASSVTQPGGFYRVRLTGKPLHLPREFHVRPGTIELLWTDPLDVGAAEQPASYECKVWSLHRSENYGSEHLGEHALEVVDAQLEQGGRRLTLQIRDFGPTQCFELVCRLRTVQGEPIVRTMHGTVHTTDE